MGPSFCVWVAAPSVCGRGADMCAGKESEPEREENREIRREKRGAMSEYINPCVHRHQRQPSPKCWLPVNTVAPFTLGFAKIVSTKRSFSVQL